MEEKIIIEMYFPSLMRSFDIEIPSRLRFHYIADMAERAVSSITGGQYVPSGCAILCDRDTGVVLDINECADRVCMHNGSRVIVI